MKPDRDHEHKRLLLSLAGSVSDGGDVDWEKVEGAANDEGERELIRQLKVLARIAAAHHVNNGEHELDESGGDSRAPDRSPPPSEVPGLKRWGHLEILERVGGGSFGEVYRAKDPNLDSEVALKLLSERESSHAVLASQVIEEGRLLARVRHTNVARVFGAERHNGRVGVWMEFIQGRNLEEFLAEHGRLGADEATVLARDLCRAVASVHRAGVVHRDIKTQNVMREEGGRIVLTDFGTGLDAEIELERPEEIRGTPLYMAPELLRGEKATVQSDIYSLGVVLYHLVTGTYPVGGQTVSEIREEHDRGAWRLLRDVRPDLPEAFKGVVEKATSPDPAARFASAGQLEQALAHALGAPEEEKSSRKRLSVAVWLAIAATAATIAMAAGWRRAASFEVEAVLYRLEGEVQELLLPGGTITPGDELLLELTGSRPLHVYVVSQDEKGETYLLFPMQGSDTRNPLPAGLRHRLPGTRNGLQVVWTVTSAGGREHIVILASRNPLDELEAEILALETGKGSPGSPPSPYARLSEPALLRLRGIGGIRERPLPTRGGPASGDLFASVQRLASRAETARGTWVRRIDLEYPQ